MLDHVNLGSALSLRSVIPLGRSLSVYGMSHLESSLSVLDYVNFGSALCLRSFIRLGCGMSFCGISNLTANSHAQYFDRNGDDEGSAELQRFSLEVTANSHAQMLILITRPGRRPADPNSTLMLNSSESRGAGRSVRANFNFRLFYV